MKHVLSKSTYIRSLQCLKSLYLYKFNYQQRDVLSKEQLQKFQRGHHIGSLAHQLFPGGVDASLKSNFKSKQAAMHTYDLINEGHKIIYEASFVYNEVWVIVDILVIDGFEWKVYEVKSSTEVSETFLHDAALQYFVMSNAASEVFKARVIDFSIIHINKFYRKKGAFNIKDFFITKPVIENCRRMTEYVKTKIEKAKEVIVEKKMPPILMGDHCEIPYPCDFRGYCSVNNLSKPKPQFQPASLPSEFTLLEILSTRNAVPAFENNFPYQYIPYAIATLDNRGVYNCMLLLNEMGKTQKAYDFLMSVVKASKTLVVSNEMSFEKLVNELRIENDVKSEPFNLQQTNIIAWKDFIKSEIEIPGKLKNDIDAEENFVAYLNCTDIFLQQELESNIENYIKQKLETIKNEIQSQKD